MTDCAERAVRVEQQQQTAAAPLDRAVQGSMQAPQQEQHDGLHDVQKQQQQQQQQQQAGAPQPVLPPAPALRRRPAPPGVLECCSELGAIEAALHSPTVPFRTQNFITSDTNTLKRLKPTRANPCVAGASSAAATTPSGAGGVEGMSGAARSAHAPPSPCSHADLMDGSVGAALAASMQRSSSQGLLSPGTLVGTLATPRFARLSSILPAGLEPEEPAVAADFSSSSGSGGRTIMKTNGGVEPAVLMAGGDRCTEVCQAAQATALLQGGMVALLQWEQTIEAAEQHWGSSHPAVGRAWLELARALQAVDKDSDRAKHATKKAFDMCQILLKQTSTDTQAQGSLHYLLDRFNSKATAAKQTRQAEAAARQAATDMHKAHTASSAAGPAATTPALAARHIRPLVLLGTAVAGCSKPQQAPDQAQSPVPVLPAMPSVGGMSKAAPSPGGVAAAMATLPHASAEQLQVPFLCSPGAAMQLKLALPPLGQQAMQASPPVPGARLAGMLPCSAAGAARSPLAASATVQLLHSVQLASELQMQAALLGCGVHGLPARLIGASVQGGATACADGASAMQQHAPLLFGASLGSPAAAQLRSLLMASQAAAAAAASMGARTAAAAAAAGSPQACRSSVHMATATAGAGAERAGGGPSRDGRLEASGDTCAPLNSLP